MSKEQNIRNLSATGCETVSGRCLSCRSTSNTGR